MAKIGMFMIEINRKSFAKDFRVSKYNEAPNPISFNKGGISRYDSKFTNASVDSSRGQCSSFDFLG